MFSNQIFDETFNCVNRSSNISLQSIGPTANGPLPLAVIKLTA